MFGLTLSLRDAEVWDQLRQSHVYVSDATEFGALYGETLPTHFVSDVLESREGQHFDVGMRSGTLGFATVTMSKAQLVFVKGLPVDFEDAWGWQQSLAALPQFLSGRVCDGEYEYWQKAHDKLQYTAVGRPWEHLPLVSNEAPFPLTRMIIDTSRNPGRRRFGRGYVEAVGAVMWLGKQFWELTGASRDEVLRQPWLRCEEPRPNVLRIQAREAPFDSAEGEQGRLQDQLRALLFPNAALE